MRMLNLVTILAASDMTLVSYHAFTDPTGGILAGVIASGMTIFVLRTCAIIRGDVHDPSDM